MAYSTTQEIRAFQDKLLNGVADDIRQNGATPDSRPMWVLDIDGNVALGYNLAPGKKLDLSEKDDPRTQSIPSDANIGELLENGDIIKSLFSVKPMDSRLPKNFVDTLNAAQAEGRDFDIVLLTSRSAKDALKILELSGVEHPEKISLVADSGAVMRLRGKESITRALQPDEKDFLTGLGDVENLSRLEGAVDKVLVAHGQPLAERPALQIEPKGIASNIHYGEILKAAGQGEDSPLDAALGKALRAELEKQVARHSPVNEKGAPAFKILGGPTTLEVKIAEVDKGKGLAAAVNAALDSGYRPSSVIVGGDDVSKTHDDGNVSHGTDHAAFSAAPKIANETGIAVFMVHTQHPMNEDPFGNYGYPHPAKVAVDVKPDLILPTPKQTADLVVNTVEKSLQKGKDIAESAQKRISTSLPLGPFR